MHALLTLSYHFSPPLVVFLHISSADPCPSNARSAGNARYTVDAFQKNNTDKLVYETKSMRQH
jgi:hypothetical protein